MGNNYIECKNCGARVHKISRNCPNCGRKLERPIYKNCAAFFCVVLIVVTFCRSIAINQIVNKCIDEVFKVLRESTSTTKVPNVDISQLENFLNSKNPSEITPDMIKDFLTKETPSDVQS